MRSKVLLFIANALGFLAFFWPFFLPRSSGSIFQHSLLAALLAGVAIVVIVFQISEELLDSKTVAIIGVLAALIASLRLLGAGAIGVEPIWFLLILSARALGPIIGYSLALISFAVSALITGGIGPWLAFQMFASGWVALGVSVIPRKLRGRSEVLSIALYGFVAALLFGIVMDLQLWPWLTGNDSQLSFVPTFGTLDNARRFLAFHFATAMAWDIPRAIVTSLLISMTGSPILHALRRAQRRLALNARAMAPEEPLQRSL